MPNQVKSGTGALVLLGTIAALYFAREVLIPFAFALTLTFLSIPAVDLLQRLHFGRALSVLTTVLVSMAVAGGIAWIIANQLVEVANQLPLYRENIRGKIDSFQHPVTGRVGKAADSLEEIARELSNPDAESPGTATYPRNVPEPASVRVVDAPASGWAELRNLGGPVLTPLAQSGVVIIFSVFMLLKKEDLRNRVLRLAGVGQLNLMTQALDDAASRVSRYLLMQFLVNAGFGSLFGFGLYWIGLPDPALWGVVAALLRIVPYVGTLTAATLPLALSLAVFDGWLKPVLVLFLAAGLEMIIANVLEPWLYGTHVGISSLALLVTAVFWAILWGPAGLILSTPLTVCLVVLGRYVPHLSFLHILLGDDPALSSEARIYQRLLAMDQPEAQAIVDRFLKERPLLELYDSVLIPALSLAEQDRHKGAISTAREEFLFLSINEMIAEFSEYQEAGEVKNARGRIFCLPAHDRADEVTASMLAQLVEQLGFAALAFPIDGTSPVEWMTLLEVEASDILCISALPPYAFAPARALCKQIRERFPKLNVVVCVWGFGGDRTKAKARFDRTPPDRLCTSLAGALESIQELALPQSAPTPPETAPPETTPMVA